MNLKTTLVLLVLAVGAGVFGFLGTPITEWLGWTPKPPDPTGAGTLEVLTSELQPEALTRIEIQARGSDRPVQLERSPGGEWTAPGQWPTRKPEVEQLVSVLTNLRSRFVPIPLAGEEALKDYGLLQPEITIKVETGANKHELRLSEHAPPREETGEADQVQQTDESAGRLDWPTYLHLDQKPEVVRLAPGLVALLSRPADYYLQRRLFTDVERVAKEGGDAQEKVEQLAATALTLFPAKSADKKAETTPITLERKDSQWRLAAPVKDRADPEKLRSILQTVPDIWAEQFVAKPEEDLSKFGLSPPEESIQVKTAHGTIELQIGKESPTVRTRLVTHPAPPMGGMPRPPLTQKVEERFRYAKLKGNRQVFEIKEDKLKDLFVPVADLRDARVARFETKDVTRLELTHGSDTIVAHKDKERWKLEKPIAGDAESSKITEILDKLAFLSARDKDILDKSDPKVDGLDKPQATLAITVEEEVKGEGETKTKKPPRTVKLSVGRHDADKKKLYIKDDWNRINVVEDSLQALLTRPATAYRGRRVLDFAAKDVEEIEVDRAGQKLVTLQQKDGSWKLAAPVAADADRSKASQLARDLGNLEVVEYVADNPKPEDLDKQYGLAKPALTAKLKLTGGKPAETLLVGKERPGKQEYFAKRAADPGVFVIKKEIYEALGHDSLAYLPLQLWQGQAADITALRLTPQGQEEYRLAKKDAAWQITGPFDAPAQASLVQPMIDELAAPRGERCVAHSAKDKELEKYGLDKPHLRITVSTKEGDKTKDRTLLVGKAEGPAPASRYAKLADADPIYVIPDRFSLNVDRAALDLLDRKLLSVSPTEIAAIKSNAGGANLRLEKHDKDWKVVESPAGQPFTADPSVATQTASLWANLNAERFAAYGPKVDWAKFGLDKPAWIVTVSTKAAPANGKPTEHTLALGKPVENQPGSRYARLDNGPGVVILSSPVVQDLERGYLDFVDRTLLKFDAATAAGLQRKAGPETLEVVKKDDAWRILKPQDLPADERTIQSLFDQLATLRADKVLAYPAKDLAQFGLDQSAAIVTLKLTGADGKPSEKVLKIGKPQSANPTAAVSPPRAVQVEASQVVGLISGTLAERLLAGPLGFRDRNLVRFADADKAMLERGRRKVTFAKVDGTWKVTEPLQTEAEQNELDDFVNVVARLRADELVADKPNPTPADLKAYGLDKPTAHWRFFAGDKEVLGLLIGNHPEKKGGGQDPRCYAKLATNNLVFLLDPRTTTSVLAEYRSKTLWPTSLDAAQVETLVYKSGASSFTLEKAGQDWKVAGKPSLKVNTAAVNETLAVLAGLKPERYVVDKGADFKLYGLEPPEPEIEAIAPTGRRTLLIGRPEGDSKRRYARVNAKDSSDVFVISVADAEKLVRQIGAFTQLQAKPAP